MPDAASADVYADLSIIVIIVYELIKPRVGGHMLLLRRSTQLYDTRRQTVVVWFYQQKRFLHLCNNHDDDAWDTAVAHSSNFIACTVDLINRR